MGGRPWLSPSAQTQGQVEVTRGLGANLPTRSQPLYWFETLLIFLPPCFHPSWPGTVSTTAEFGKAVLVVVTSVCKGAECMSMRKTLRDGRGGGGEGGQTRQGEAMRKGQQEATEAEIAVRLKEKNAPKS